MEVEISLPQDPGQAGKAQALALARALDGYTVRASPESGDKATRFGPFSAQCEAGRVHVLRGEWNEGWFAALEAFPEGRHDDDADSTSRAFNAFSASCEAGRVHVLRGEWNEGWFAALEAFPEGRHDDDADSTSRAFNAFLAQRLNSEGFLELLRRQAGAPS